MLLGLVSAGLLGAVAYVALYPSKKVGGSSVTELLNNRINNEDERFRDVTYTDKIELANPDIKNNMFYYSGSFAQDRGNNGIPRAYAQLHPGSSEITQFTLAEHLFL